MLIMNILSKRKGLLSTAILCCSSFISCVLFTSCNSPQPLITDGECLTSDSTEFSGTLNVYIDASGSMKGFVDVHPSDYKNNMPVIVSDLRRKLVKDTEKEKYYLVKEWKNNTPPEALSWDSFRNRLIDGKEYSGKTTLLHTLISQSVECLQSDDVTLVVTDGVLSMGHDIASKSPHGNADYLGDLKREVKETMENLYAKDLDVAIMRTTCSYNGYYYCNCKENDKLSQYKDRMMKQRPLFYIMMGKRDALSKVVSAIKVENTDRYELSYFSKKIPDLKYSIIESEASGSGINEISYPLVSDTVNRSSIQIELELDYLSDDYPVSFYVCLPPIPENSICSMDSLLGNCPNDFVQSANLVTKAECQADVQSCSDEFWQEFDVFYKITLKSGSEIRKTKIKDGTMFLLYENPLSNKIYSIPDDIGKSLAEMENKTFGWETFMNAIYISSYKENMVKDVIQKNVFKSKLGRININFKTK